MELASAADSILEIGSRYGQTLKRMAFMMKTKGRVVSVDLPNSWWGYEDSEKHLREGVAELEKLGYDARLFIGDSRDPAIVSEVKSLGPFDLVFLDGDHRYEGVKADWLNYGPMGKTVVFHDIQKDEQKEVFKLWAEIEGKKQTFIGGSSKMGLGIIEW